MIDTFSANSLSLLDKDPKAFIDKYINNLFIYKRDEKAKLGEIFHSLIASYLKGFDIEKLISSLNEKELQTWNSLKNEIQPIKENFIKIEYSFLTKNILNNKFYYLTGRFDAIYKNKDEYIIYDWKSLNLPKNPESNIQSIVYLYCASEIFKTQKIKIRYFSIEKLNWHDVIFENKEFYKNKIENIILKLKDY